MACHAVLQGKEGTAIYRTSIDMTRQMLTEGQTMIEFACVDDAGTLFVNVRKWQATMLGTSRL